ncbi:MAG TPA: glycosyltransferase family 4 protein [Phycisphaerales bacterium]|nr:glycosyltransferase family 4 protein [Phycisphaerales bacterium]
MSVAAIEQPSPTAARPMNGMPKSAMRIAYLTTEYPKVSHTFIRREILELERRGHRVLRLAIRGAGSAIADVADRDEAQRTIVCLNLPKLSMLASIIAVKVTRPLKWLKALAMTWRMARVSDRGMLRHFAYLWEAAVLLRICQRESIQHVHVHFGTNAAAVARLMRCLGGPTYSMTVHGPDEFDSPRTFSLGDKVADASFVCAISDFCSAQIRRWCEPQHWNKIHVVRCTVGTEFFERARPVPAQTQTLLSVGRLSAQKGQLLLIEAMRRLRDEGIDAKLIVAGDGEMRSEIERAIAQARLTDHVMITGWVDEAAVREHLLNARALVQPSFAEGLPVVMMEALAMQRPVIATMIAGVPELVRHGENGWLIAAGSVEELVTAMRAALESPVEQLNRMGAAGARRVRERHYTPSEVDRIEALLLAVKGAG